MKHIVKKWLAGILSVVMVFSLLPVMARAEEDGETPEKTAVEQVQALIDALPDADTITADNRADVQTQIEAIDAAIAELTEDQAASLDTSRYDAAAAALLALDAPSALEQVQALIDALPDADTITADNRADVEAQLSAIDEAKLGLEDEELDGLDITRYMAAVEAILALDDVAGADEPATIATESSIKYLDWDEGQKKLVEKTRDSATRIESSTTKWTTGWYVVSNTVMITSIVEVSGDVHLILKDGKTLTADNGIRVSDGNSLTIYGQSGHTGNLLANIHNINELDRHYAAIGGGSNESGGTIIINGGNITAKNEGSGGAGIGGGWKGSGGTITINGGTVTATSSVNGAAIGGGSNGDESDECNGGIITINGGTVIATTPNTDSAAIGGGRDGDGGTITITGGTVTATSGGRGAGIGGGKHSNGGTITINGGTITAESHDYGAAIGGGGAEWYLGGEGGEITITGGTITATSGSGAKCSIGGGTSEFGNQPLSGSGTFSTGTSGKAVIYANKGIQDTSGKSSWSGIIFEGNEGTVYGNQTLAGSFEVKAGGTLNIPNESGLTVTGTVTNKGTIEVWGVLEGDSKITNSGSGKIIYHYDPQVDPPTFNNAKYGYPEPEAQSITVKNNGGVSIDITEVKIEGNDFEFTAGTLGTLKKGESNETWKIRPKANLGAGKYTATITVSYIGTASKEEGTLEAEVSFTVTKADADLTVEPVPAYTYGTDGGITLTATVAPAAANGISLMSAGQNQVVFAFQKGGKTETRTVDAGGGTVTVNIPVEQVKEYFNQGVNTVTVSYGGSINLEQKESVEVTVTVNPKTLTFTFTAKDKTYDGDSDIEGTFAALTDQLVSGDNVGVETFTATTADENAGVDKPVTVKVTKLKGSEAEYYTPGTVDGGTVDISKAKIGSVTKPTVTNHTYNGQDQALLTGEASGVPSSATITYFVGAKGDSSKPSGNEDTGWGDMPTTKAKDAGTYTVWYKVTGGMNYEDIEPTRIGEATIEQKPVTLTWSGHTGLVYTGTAKNVTATFLNDEIVDGDKGEVSVSVTNGDRVDANPDSTYTATATLEGNRADNYKLTNNTQTYTISKATASVAVSASDTPTYGENITLTATVTVSDVDASHITGTVQFTDGDTTLGTAKVEGGVATLTISDSQRNEQHALFGSTGSSNVTAKYNGDSNINGGSGDATVNITPKVLTYTVTATGKVYDGDAAVVVQLVPNNLVPGDSVTLTASGSLSSADANTYHQVNLSNITKEGADAKYYSVDDSASNKELQDGVTISPKVVALDWKLDDSDTFTISYDGGPHTATATVNNKALEGDDVGVTVEVKPDSGTGAGPYNATATDAGNYTATATELTGGAKDNYTLNGSDTATQAIAISKVLATCTTPPTANEDLTYMGEAQKLVTAGTTAGGTMMYALGESGSTEPGNEAFDSDIPTGTDAKTYYVWYYVQGDGNHGDSEKKCVEVTIGPAPVSFTIGEEVKVDWPSNETNGDPNPEGYVIEGTNLTMTYDSYEHKANVTQTEDEAVTIEKKAENGYSVTYKRVKDAEGKDVTEDAVEAVRDAGTYEIWVTINPVSSSEDVRNYVFEGHEGDTELKIGEITVNPYEITVAWTHLSYVYHGHAMHPNITVLNAFKNDLYTGTSLPTDFDPDTYNGNRVIAFGATEGSDVGEYTVTAKLYGTSAGNYTVDDNTETVTIVPAPVTFTVGDNVWVIGEGGALSRDTVTLRPAWGAVSTTPDVAVHHSYPLAGTKLDVDTLNVTIEYWQNGEKVEAPGEAGKYEVWVKIGNENYRHSATETGELHHVGELVITDDPNSIRTYTVTFDPGYEGAPKGPAAIEKAFPNQTVVLPPVSGENEDGTTYDMTRKGYSFLGWSYNGHTYQPNEELHMPAADVTFKGEWIEAVPIGGRVVQESSGGEPTPVNGATVVLKQGSEPTAEAVTESDGSFDFGLVTPGIYNLEVTYENGGGAKIVKTFLIEVGDSGSVDNEFVLPDAALNTVVEVAPGIKSAVSMDGMITDEAAADVYTESDKKTVENGGTVEFKMSISEATLTDDQEEEIPVPEERISMVLDMKLTKTVTENGGASPTLVQIHDSKIPVTTVIHLPAEIQGKSGYTVYRFHDEDGDGNKEMRAITTSKNENGEYLQVVREGTAIELHAEFYSTYVLTWYQSSGSGATAYPVTLPENALNGTVTANYEKAVKNSVVTLTVTPDEGHVLGELTVTDSDGNAIALTDNGDGTYSFVMPDGGVTVKAVFNCEGGENCQSRKFTDLDVKAWYHDYTDYVIGCGLMHGVGGKLFDPNGAVTRAQMVTVLWNMSGDPVVNYYMTYSDVSESAWYAEAIRWATSEGVVDGYGNGKFGPNDVITREQMATMLYRYEQKYGDGGFTGEWMYRLPFTDLDQISDWAFEAVAWCNMKGIITGKDGNRVDPKGSAKRCEMAAVLTRYCAENDTENDTE